MILIDKNLYKNNAQKNEFTIYKYEYQINILCVNFSFTKFQRKFIKWQIKTITLAYK